MLIFLLFGFAFGDLYKLLGTRKEQPPEEQLQAFRSIAIRYHPTLYPDLPKK
jgi:curved DNA-binding protein CbpA